jgi:hypothetical protein
LPASENLDAAIRYIASGVVKYDGMVDHLRPLQPAPARLPE